MALTRLLVDMLRWDALSLVLCCLSCLFRNSSKDSPKRESHAMWRTAVLQVRIDRHTHGDVERTDGGLSQNSLHDGALSRIREPGLGFGDKQTCAYRLSSPHSTELSLLPVPVPLSLPSIKHHWRGPRRFHVILRPRDESAVSGLVQA